MTSQGEGGTGGGGGSDGYVPLRSVDGSGQSEVAFDQGNIDGTYRKYVIGIYELTPATDDTQPQGQISTDGGSTYKSGNSDYAHAIHRVAQGSSTATNGSTGASQFDYSEDTVGNAASEGMQATLTLYDPAGSTTEKMIKILTTRIDANGGRLSGQGSAWYKTAESYNAIKLFFSSGNISNGTFDLYGVTEPT